MRDDKKGTQAWITCNDILNKIKTELITQAMDTVKDALDQKLIEVNGSLISVPDKPSDTEMYMFLVNKLVSEKDRIMHSYREYLDGASDAGLTPQKAQQAERLRKFLLCVEKMSMLMRYSEMMDEWMRDVSMQIKAADVTSIISSTYTANAERIELLNYVMKNQVIAREKVLTKEERESIESSLHRAAQRP